MWMVVWEMYLKCIVCFVVRFVNLWALVLACFHIICSARNRYPWCSPPFFVANVFYAMQMLCLKFRQPKHCCI